MPRVSPPPANEIRPGVAVAAVGLVAIALGLGALAFDRDDTPEAAVAASASAPRAQSRATASAAAPLARRGPMPDRERIEALVPRPRSAAPRPKPVARRVSAAPAVVEPQWDGQGLPSREFLRWQLETLVAQGNPHGSVSQGALDAAIDDALALRAAKLEVESARSPEALVAAQERLENASRSLAANLGVEAVDFSAF